MAPFHEVWPSESHETRPVHHENDVGESRQVCAAGDARSHHRRELRNPQIATHDGVVVKDAGRPVLTGKHPPLVRQIHAGGVHEVDDRNAAPHSDLLGPQHLLDGLGPPRSRLHGGVVRHHNDLPPFNHAHSRHHAGTGGTAVVLIVGNEQADLEPRAPGIQKVPYPFAGGQLSLVVLTLDPFRSAALQERGPELLQLLP